MTGYIIISQMKTVVLETAIEILRSNNIKNNNNNKLASAKICYSHVLEKDIQQKLSHFPCSKFVFVKDFILE
jgi:hypothetical protein